MVVPNPGSVDVDVPAGVAAGVIPAAATVGTAGGTGGSAAFGST